MTESGFFAARHGRRLAVLGLLLGCQSVFSLTDNPTLTDPGQVCITNGAIEKAQGSARTFVINAPSSRAVAKSVDDSRGAIRFEYLGPAENSSKLASGVVRRQLGVKLRAEDSCNVIYVMWGIEPQPGLIVSMKVNKGKTKHAECGPKGYTLVKPTLEKPIAPIKIGEPRQLAAAIEGTTLTVKVDGETAWVGEVDATAEQMSGYTGIRTDNVRVRFEWLTEASAPVARARGLVPPQVACKKVSGF